MKCCFRCYILATKVGWLLRMDTTQQFRVYQNCTVTANKVPKDLQATHSSALLAIPLTLSLATCLRRTLLIASCCKQFQKLCIVIDNVSNAKTKLALLEFLLTMTHNCTSTWLPMLHHTVLDQLYPLLPRWFRDICCIHLKFPHS